VSEARPPQPDLAERVGGLLAARGQPWPGPIEYLETTTSTKDDMKER